MRAVIARRATRRDPSEPDDPSDPDDPHDPSDPDEPSDPEVPHDPPEHQGDGVGDVPAQGRVAHERGPIVVHEPILPAGQTGDEGWFLLDAATLPFTLQDSLDGVVPQEQLDRVQGVVPLDDADLEGLVGLRCAAIVFDSDISVNDVHVGNLQGERYGRMDLEVLEVFPAGTLPESGWSSSLHDVGIVVLLPYEADLVGARIASEGLGEGTGAGPEAVPAGGDHAPLGQGAALAWALVAPLALRRRR